MTRWQRYLVACFTITWAAWWPLAALGGVDGGAAPLLLVGGLGPVLAALLTTDADGRRDLWRRSVEVGRVPGRWWWVIAAVGIGPALAGTAVAAPVGIDDRDPAWGVAALGAVAFAVAAGVAEEPGWRGTLQDELLARRLVASSIVVGAVWAVWHLPLYFAEGTFQHDNGLAWLGVSFVALPALSVLMAWVYLHTARSVLAAVVIHALGNATGELLPGGEVATVTTVVVLTVAALVVAAVRSPLRAHA